MSDTSRHRDLGKVARRFLPVMAVFLTAPTSSYAQEISGSRDVQRIRIHELAVVKARPDTAYILMKVEAQSSRLGHAIAETDKRAAAFTAALRDAGIPDSAIRLSNFLVSPAISGAGYCFARNVIIVIEG
ncbi:MAG: SIMPL domain-containing protein, partial [Acidobacteriota bacterium]